MYLNYGVSSKQRQPVPHKHSGMCYDCEHQNLWFIHMTFNSKCVPLSC